MSKLKKKKSARPDYRIPPEKASITHSPISTQWPQHTVAGLMGSLHRIGLSVKADVESEKRSQ